MTIREYQPGDEEKILSLFKLVYKKELDLKFWQWRFLENPYNYGPKINLMFEDDELIGHYAVFPVDLILNENIFSSALSMTTMTHPNYEGKGIFTKLASDLYSRLESENFNCVWGFPNANSHYGFINKLNWKNNFVLPNLQFNDLNYRKDTDFVLHTNFNNLRIDKLNQKDQLTVYKSINYLNWRYLLNPINQYYILEFGPSHDFIVCKIFEQNGQFEVDILEHGYEPNTEACSNMLSSIYLLLQTLNIEAIKINTWCNLQLNRYSALERVGFSPTLPLTYFGMLNFNNSKLENSYFKYWNINLGDSDIY